MIIPLGDALLRRSSNLPGSANGPFDQLPYLVLLHAGFGLPRLSPAARCALTAPFHPYPSTRIQRLAAPNTRSGRYVFCATVRRVAPPGCYPAHCPVEFGLSSPRGTSSAVAFQRRRMVTASSDRPAHCSPNRLSGRRARRPISRRVPAKSGIARVSCTNCCGGYRSPPPSSRCSSCSHAASLPDTRARSRT